MTKLHSNKERGAEMKARRLAKGIRADFVAALMGISKSQLSRLESGQRSWTSDLSLAFLRSIGADSKPNKGNHHAKAVRN